MLSKKNWCLVSVMVYLKRASVGLRSGIRPLTFFHIMPGTPGPCQVGSSLSFLVPVKENLNSIANKDYIIAKALLHGQVACFLS